VVVGYKNMDKLKKLIAPHTYRVTKDECLDLPKKLYQKEYVELTKGQRKLYNTLRDELIIEFENGEHLTAALKITQMLRLQQIVGGYLPTDEGSIVQIEENNPRMKRIIEIAEVNKKTKVIIWARFVAEIKEITKMLAKEYGKQSVVAYYGDVSDDDRSEAKRRFQNDKECRFFVGNAQAGGRGLTLHAANIVIYYSNSFSLEQRLQSEDRAHRIGQERNVLYIDFVAPDTLDTKVVESLRGKKEIADMLTGDDIKEWL
jgi:SNF2 family DNA or RNA helicase